MSDKNTIEFIRRENVKAIISAQEWVRETPMFELAKVRAIICKDYSDPYIKAMSMFAEIGYQLVIERMEEFRERTTEN